MRHQRLSTEDLLDAASAQGAKSIEEIDRAFLNSKGEIVVVVSGESELTRQIALLTAQVQALITKTATPQS
jgi:uncharacterized membrane protein YcaP (DUF421 family)